jgi:hypothetical protein
MGKRHSPTIIKDKLSNLTRRELIIDYELVPSLSIDVSLPRSRSSICFTIEEDRRRDPLRCNFPQPTS